jgi:hypothetical protein
MTELSQKADFALSELTSATVVCSTPNRTTPSFDLLIDQPTILRAVRTVPMNTPQMKLNKIGFGSRILKVAPQGTAPYMQDSGANNRWLAATDRSKPTTSQITLTTSEVMAEVRIPYEVLEDNIERGGMADTVLALIAERAALDLEELLITGDTASGDAYLALMNGILKRVTSNVVDAQNGSDLGRPVQQPEEGPSDEVSPQPCVDALLLVDGPRVRLPRCGCVAWHRPW